MIGELLSRPRNLALLVAAVVVVLAAVFVLTRGGGSDAASKVPVAAAFAPLAEQAERIGGAHVDVTDLTPLGGQPHLLQPSPAAQGALKRAKLAIYLGGDFQPAVVDAIAKLPATTTKLDQASDGETLPSPRPIRGARGTIEGAPVRSGGADPHVWLDPERFAGMAQRTQAALVAAAPEHRADFEARGGKYVAELTALADEFAAGLSACRGKTILTTHPAYGYLAERYGLEQAVVAGLTPDAAPNPKTLAAIATYVRANDIETLFTTTPLPSRTAKVIERETGAKLATLNPVEGITLEQQERKEGYVQLMRANLTALQQGLGCGPEGAPTSPEATSPPATSPTTP